MINITISKKGRIYAIDIVDGQEESALFFTKRNLFEKAIREYACKCAGRGEDVVVVDEIKGTTMRTSKGAVKVKDRDCPLVPKYPRYRSNKLETIELTQGQRNRRALRVQVSKYDAGKISIGELVRKGLAIYG